ncbi:aaa-family atpase [Anaeramoeba flamelloides]|uniref:Aaa-family atpase n=1 Tax=Anaeramoeba flamelloides TaxID=1746091 RepID=A0AAV7ZZQ8_9EUKA|nr:aaa-family atpase [Anaeramoeba flamelloides]
MNFKLYCGIEPRYVTIWNPEECFVSVKRYRLLNVKYIKIKSNDKTKSVLLNVFPCSTLENEALQIHETVFNLLNLKIGSDIKAKSVSNKLIEKVDRIRLSLTIFSKKKFEYLNLSQVIKREIPSQLLSRGSSFPIQILGGLYWVKIDNLIFTTTKSNKKYFQTLSCEINELNLKIKQKEINKNATIQLIEGFESEKIEIQNLLKDFSANEETVTEFGVNQYILIKGCSGVGKTTFLSYIETISTNIFSFNIIKLSISKFGVKDYLKKKFQLAIELVPSIILIDDFDQVCKLNKNNEDYNYDNNSDNDENYKINFLSNKNLLNEKRVLVFATCNEHLIIDPTFTKNGFFDYEILLSLPNNKTRIKIISNLLNINNNNNNNNNKSNNENNLFRINNNLYSFPNMEKSIVKISSLTQGFTPKDLFQLICRFLSQIEIESFNLIQENQFNSNNDNNNDNNNSNNNNDNTNINNTNNNNTNNNNNQNNYVEIKWKHFLNPLRELKNNSKLLKEFTFNNLNISLNDFVGYESIKKSFLQIINLSLISKNKLQNLGLKHPSGILLVGPTGCGKTTLINGSINKFGISTLYVNGPALFSKYLGETELTIRNLFARARRQAPCIVLLEQVDAVGIKRTFDSDSQIGIEERALSQLLNEIDGISKSANILVIGTSNNPLMLDDALIRPGRLEKILYLGLPNLNERKLILLKHAPNMANSQSSDFFEILAKETKGFTGSDLVTLCRYAAINSVRKNKNKNALVKEKHFLSALKEIHQQEGRRIGISQKNLLMFEMFLKGINQK